jgi:hypothetical protein
MGTPISEGAARREAIVERVVDQFAPLSGDPAVRFYTFGPVRIAVLETVTEMCGLYPTLSNRIQERFGISGLMTS